MSLELAVISSGATTMCSFRQSPLSKSQEKFADDSIPRDAARLKSSLFLFGSYRNRVLPPRIKRILQGYSLLLHRPRIISFINTAARGRAFMPGFCASSPLAILPVRLTKEPHHRPGLSPVPQ